MSDIAQRLSPDAAPWTTFRLAAIECTTCPESRDIPCSCMSLVLPVLLASSVCHCNHVKDLSLSQRQRRTTSSAPKATAKVHQSFQIPKFMTGFFRKKSNKNIMESFFQFTDNGTAHKNRSLTTTINIMKHNSLHIITPLFSVSLSCQGCYRSTYRQLHTS